MLHGAQKRKPNDYARITRITTWKRLGLHRTVGRRLPSRSCRATRLGHFNHQARQVMHRVCCCTHCPGKACADCSGEIALPSSVLLTPSSSALVIHTSFPSTDYSYLCNAGDGDCDIQGNPSTQTIYFPTSIVLTYCGCQESTPIGMVSNCAVYRCLYLLRTETANLCCSGHSGTVLDPFDRPCCAFDVQTFTYLIISLKTQSAPPSHPFFDGCIGNKIEIVGIQIRVGSPCMSPCGFGHYEDPYVNLYSSLPSEATLLNAFFPCTCSANCHCIRITGFPTFRAKTQYLCEPRYSYFNASGSITVT